MVKMRRFGSAFITEYIEVHEGAMGHEKRSKKRSWRGGMGVEQCTVSVKRP
jgi:hypothetical protein